jgi:hypothetical protein
MALKYEKFVEVMVEEVGIDEFLHYLELYAQEKRQQFDRMARYSPRDEDEMHLKQAAERWQIIQDKVMAFKEEIKPIIP